ncbi:MAG: hypothetical protein LM589_04240 [Thermosphaera sp.]|nr:hypothetical protein [Thermosphaera sp.]
MGALIKLYKFYVKNNLKDPYYWFWAVLFILFWLYIGAFVWGANMSIERIRSTIPHYIADSTIHELWIRATIHYTGAWYATNAVFSLSLITVGLVYTVYYATIPIRYLTKYSKVSSVKFYSSLVLTALSSAILATVILIVATVLMYSYRFHGLKTLILPHNPLGVFSVTLTAMLFKYFFAMTLSLLTIVIRKPRFLLFIGFIPFIISYALGMYTLQTGGGPVNLSPYSAVLLLNYHYFTGGPIVENQSVTDMWRYDPLFNQYIDINSTSTPRTVDPFALWIVLSLWILVTGVTAFILFRIQKGVGYEELIS